MIDAENIIPNDAEWRLIAANADADVRQLALKLKSNAGVRNDLVLRQIEGRQQMARKAPSLAAADGVVFPRHLSVEQCSSEATARYKASLVGGDALVDLTGGFGVDFAFMAPKFQSATYVEQQSELAAIAANNMPRWGLPDATIICADATEYLCQMQHADCIYIDPARRSAAGAKCVRLSDCTPDLTVLAPELLAKASTVVAKLSPMLDLSELLSSIRHVAAVHIVAVGNECKEIVALLRRGDEETAITAVNLLTDSRVESFTFRYSEERSAVADLATAVCRYLYEPNAAILKAGAFRCGGLRFGLCKLHRNSHLYTSDTLVKDFPGRVFEVVDFGGLGKNSLPAGISKLKKANLSVRNFPLRTDVLRSKLKLSEGGDDYIFATTLSDDRHALILCKKVIR
ncbi:MAG: SAM-dependent methyltransferase [Bacteroidales bacterium]|nr:SAM-dependent methyltransferase [Bacteroidales bacterium]